MVFADIEPNKAPAVPKTIAPPTIFPIDESLPLIES